MLSSQLRISRSATRDVPVSAQQLRMQVAIGRMKLIPSCNEKALRSTRGQLLCPSRWTPIESRKTERVC